jgi:hypothetical protein
MAEPDKRPVTMEALLISSLAQTDALAKLLIEKGLITREEFVQKISEERGAYRKVMNPTPQLQLKMFDHVFTPIGFPASVGSISFAFSRETMPKAKMVSLHIKFSRCS